MKIRYSLTLFLLAALVLTTVNTTAQTRRASVPATPKLEDLPRRVLDTIATEDPETFIVLYSNNTFDYYRPELKRMDELPVYRNNWDTTSIFSYRNINLEDLPQIVELKLIDHYNEFRTPVQAKVFSKYGPRRRANHNGVDLPMKTGEPIFAAFDGKVRYAKYNTGGFGNLVIVRHPNGLETWHAHLSKMNVKVNDYVKVGQVIGFLGNTGRSRGPHLHFEVRYCDQSFDPEFLFDFENGQLRYQTFALERSFFNIRSRATELLEEEDDYDMPTSLLAQADDSTLIRAKETAEVSATQPVYHVVKQGDILGRIAPRYGTTIDRICKLNGITRNTTLRLGQRLRVK